MKNSRCTFWLPSSSGCWSSSWGSYQTQPSQRAANLLRGLLDEAGRNPAGASASVTLAAAEILRWGTLTPHIDFAKIVNTYGEMLEWLIVTATWRGIEQGPITFAALADKWRRVDEAGFLRLFRRMPTPSRDDMTNTSELEAWGEIYEALACLDGFRRGRMLEEALAFHTKAGTRYARTHQADVLTKLGSAEEAASVLGQLLQENIKGKSRAWALFRLSEAQAARGDLDAAIAAANEAAAALPDGDSAAPRFAEWRAQLEARRAA